MRARRVIPKILINGVDVTDTLSGCLTGMTYTDPASGESDSADLTFSDRDRKWLGAWMPEKGDILTLSAVSYWWEEDNSVSPDGPAIAETFTSGPGHEIHYGEFILDSFSFSGNPVSVRLSAVSAPVDTAFKATKRSKTWEAVTLEEIAQEISGRAGLALTYDADTIQIDAVEQEEKEDSAFLETLAEKYGLSMKIYAKRIILFDREKYKEAEPVITFRYEDVISWSWQTDLQGSYTGAKLQYTDPMTEKKIEYMTGTEERLLEVSGSADSEADAEKKAKAALASANHGITTMRVETLGHFTAFASQTAEVKGFGKLDGKYYINQVTHNLTGGFTSTYELSKIE